jgi:hypothetical protein
VDTWVSRHGGRSRDGAIDFRIRLPFCGKRVVCIARKCLGGVRRRIRKDDDYCISGSRSVYTKMKRSKSTPAYDRVFINPTSSLAIIGPAFSMIMLFQGEPAVLKSLVMAIFALLYNDLFEY